MKHMIDAPNGRHFTDSEIDAMAGILRKRFGEVARGVAELFALEHEKVNDLERSQVWARVAARLPQALDSAVLH